MHLHQQLRQAREEARLTQGQLARLAGIPRNQVVRAERGDNITIDTLRKIAVHLPVTTLTLLENVQMTADLLPEPEKVYLGAMTTLAHMTEALGSALGLAMTARVAMAAHGREPLRQEGGVEPLPEDDLLLLKSIESWYRDLEHKIQETARLDAERSLKI